MRKRGIAKVSFLLIALAGAVLLKEVLSVNGPVEIKLVSLTAIPDSDLKAATIEFRRRSSNWVNFAEELQVQSRVLGRWLGPAKFPDVEDTTLLRGTVQEQLVFRIPREADACRFLLAYRPSSPYCRAYFYFHKHGFTQTFPGVSRWAPHREHKKAKWRKANPELKLPATVSSGNLPHNKAGVGNGAMTLSFHVGRHGRAVPDLYRLCSLNACDRNDFHRATG